MAVLRRATATGVVAAVALGLAGARADLDAAHGALPVRGAAIDVLLHEDPSLALRDVDAAADLGSTTVRLSIQWSGLEPVQRGELAQWYLDRLDAVVARARARGLKVLLTPVFSPPWASSSGEPSAAPDDPADYGRIVGLLAARYGSALAGIEVWNEPNLVSFWSAPDAAVRYAELLRSAYAQIKAADPAVPVVAGAISGADTGFLGELYAAGIAGSYDVLSVHVYNDGRAPEALIDPRWAHATFLQGLQNLRDALTAHGERRPVWITELGWNTSTLRGALWLDGVTLAEQADYLGRALAMLESPTSGIDFVSGALVYRLRDIGTDPDEPQHNYGLQRHDGTPKPSFDAVRAAFTQPPPATSTPTAAPAPSAPLPPAPPPPPPPAAAPVTALPPAPPVATSAPAPRAPAKLRVRRARLHEGRLDVLAEMTRRASGELEGELTAGGRRHRFRAEIAESGRVRIDERLPRAMRRSRTGIVELTYAGNERVRRDDVRVRAAPRKAQLRRTRTTLEDGRLRVEGTISDRASGVVRIRLETEDAAGGVRRLRLRAPIEHGRWVLDERLSGPAASGGQLSIQFTGDLGARMRGEQTAKQVG